MLSYFWTLYYLIYDLNSKFREHTASAGQHARKVALTLPEGALRELPEYTNTGG
jgi:hypothetical protein